MVVQKAMSFILGASLSPVQVSSPLAHAQWYRQQQATNPVQYAADAGVWQVFRYEDVWRVLTDYEYFSSELLIQGFPEEYTLNTDPPKHQNYRKIVAAYFTPRKVEQLGNHIALMVDEILARGTRAREIDIVEQLAYPLPIRVIGEMLGLPAEDEERLRDWSNQLVGVISSPDDPENQEFKEYICDQLERRTADPQDDLISILLAAREAGQLTQGEVLFLCMGLVAAGNITTTMLLSLAVRRFLAQPEVYQAIRSRPDLIPAAIEEILRSDFVRTTLMRLVRRDTVLSGKEIKAGEMVLAWISAANFDESVFEQALQFQIERSPNPHLAFGHGPRYCLGAPLARLEAKIVLERMVAEWASIRGKPDAPPVYVDPRFDLILSYPIVITPDHT